MNAPLAIFRPGPHYPALDAEALTASAQAYDPALHEAPIVLGHPATDAPAHGWVKSLAFSEGLLKAVPHQVQPHLAEGVRKGLWKKISASFYRPGAAPNPKPGVYYLRHVGLLGAQPPEVKGLPPVQFSDAAADWISVDFSERDPWMFRLLSRLFRSQREHLIQTADLETADRVLPDYDIQALADEAERQMRDERDEAATPQPIFSEDDVTQPGANDNGPTAAELAQRQADLDAREARLNSREGALTTSEAEQARRQAVAFCDELVTQGRLLPRDKDAMVEFMETLPAEATVTFAEGDATIAKPGEARAFFRQFLARLPVQVDFTERAAATGDDLPGDAKATLRVPEGYQVAQDQAALHQRILQFAEKNNVSYNEAVSAVARLEA